MKKKKVTHFLYMFLIALLIGCDTAYRNEIIFSENTESCQCKIRYNDVCRLKIRWVPKDVGRAKNRNGYRQEDLQVPQRG